MQTHQLLIKDKIFSKKILKKRGKYKLPKTPTLKVLAGKQIDKFEKYAIRSTVGKKLLTMIYRSEIYTFWNKRINEFKEIKQIQKIRQNPIPQHIAIIMDGNRRFAKGLGIQKDKGHIFGRDKIEEVLDWCFELKIKNLTIYAFSKQNFERETSEVQTLMQLCKNELKRASKDSRIHKNKVKVRILGQLDSLPEDISISAKELMEKTKDYNSYSFNIALAYGGREEIINAIQKIAKQVKDGKIKIEDIDEELFSNNLYTEGLPDPDLILRTSGEVRISNFLLWQLAYSELYFSDVYWPAFQKKDFLEAIYTCQLRQRRYGK